MTHPDNWVQKQIDDVNVISGQQKEDCRWYEFAVLDKEEVARLTEWIFEGNKQIDDVSIGSGQHEADLHMRAKYTDISTPKMCLVCGKFHVDTGLPCTDYQWDKFYHPITTEDDMKDLRQWVVKDTKVPVFKLYYDKTLRLSEGKLAAQVGHVVAHLTLKQGKVPSKIIVLEASHTKFESYCKSADYVQRDMGLTEVEEGTATVCGSAEFE